MKTASRFAMIASGFHGKPFNYFPGDRKHSRGFLWGLNSDSNAEVDGSHWLYMIIGCPA